jgi:hypothetical protein
LDGDLAYPATWNLASAFTLPLKLNSMLRLRHSAARLLYRSRTSCPVRVQHGGVGAPSYSARRLRFSQRRSAVRPYGIAALCVALLIVGVFALVIFSFDFPDEPKA